MLWPEPVLVGRSEAKLARHRRPARPDRLDHRPRRRPSPATDIQVYFDAQVTSAREKALRTAIEAGKHIYTEKPLAETLDRRGRPGPAAPTRAGIEHGVVQDKLFLPGLRKLKRLVDGGFFGRILSVRGEFGYWVFEGDWQPAQRPSWNYRAEDGGGIVAGHVPALALRARAAVRPGPGGAPRTPPRTSRARVTRTAEPYEATADDAAYGIFELDGGVVAQINSSWAVRVNRDELVEFQVDGTHGSAVAGLRDCRIQHRAATPKPVWNPDLPATERLPRAVAGGARQRRRSTTASRRSGSRSCGTSSRTRRSRGTSPPAPAACSSPSSGSIGPEGGGSRCRAVSVAAPNDGPRRLDLRTRLGWLGLL